MPDDDTPRSVRIYAWVCALLIYGILAFYAGMMVEHYNDFGHLPAVSPEEEPCLTGDRR